MSDPANSPRSGRALAIAAAVSLALVWSTQSGGLMRGLAGLPDIPYLRAILASFSDVLAMVALVALAARRSPAGVLDMAGLRAPIRRPLVWTLVWVVPALTICLIWARVAPDLQAADIAWLSVGGPFTEELVYRGLAVGVLMRLCGWPLWAACLWPAVFFGVVHLWQGSDPGEMAGVVALTGVGGLLFGWLFVRWGYNLWPPVLLHVGLNTLWQVFDLGGNAIGGWVGNAERLTAVVLAILATLRLAPARPLPPGSS